MKIDEKMVVNSPRFKLSGVEFSIRVAPGFNDFEFICVTLINCSKESQTTSVTSLEGSGVEKTWKMDECKANSSWGFPEFLSHEEFRALAKKHGDVFKLKTTVTLHKKIDTTGDSWRASQFYTVQPS